MYVHPACAVDTEVSLFPEATFITTQRQLSSMQYPCLAFSLQFFVEVKMSVERYAITGRKNQWQYYALSQYTPSYVSQLAQLSLAKFPRSANRLSRQEN